MDANNQRPLAAATAQFVRNELDRYGSRFKRPLDVQWPAVAAPTTGHSPYRDDHALLRWFGESKVVDHQGRPLAVYHGTVNRFRRFKIPHPGIIRDGRGSWLPGTTERWLATFDEDVETARHFATEFGQGGYIMPCFLRVLRPADFRFEIPNDFLAALAHVGGRVDAVSRLDPADIWVALDRDSGGWSFATALRFAGYDGLVWSAPDTGRCWGVLGAHQIKSAIYNSGEFSEGTTDLGR